MTPDNLSNSIGCLLFGAASLLGVWGALFVAWCVVLILWIRQLRVYNKAYRKYQQACREYEEAPCQPSEKLRLTQKRLCDFNQSNSVMLKSLRRLGLIVGYADFQCRPCKLVNLSRVRIVCESVNEKLDVSGTWRSKATVAVPAN